MSIIKGPIARVGPNDLVTSSPELLAHMNAVRSPYTRAAWYNSAWRVEPGRDHIFSEINEDRHRKRRQQMAAGVSSSPREETMHNTDVSLVLWKGESRSRV
jgi:hypothetical protein